MLPGKTISHTYDSYLQGVNPTIRWVYVGVLAFLVLVCIALPFIPIDIQVSAEGNFTPSIERESLSVPVAGQIETLSMKDNMRVSKGQFLLRLKNESLYRSRQIVQMQIEQKSQEVRDLYILSTYNFLDSTAKLSLESRTYQIAGKQLEREVKDFKARLAIVQKKYDRNLGLFKKGVITRSDYETVQMNLEETQNNLSKTIESKQLDWKLRQRQLQDELDQLKQSEAQQNEDIRKLTFKAPIAGSIQMATGLSVGTWLPAGSEVAKLSPDTSLIITCLIPPRDIGLIKKGQKVKFQVQAFNYNDWGLLYGEVTEIASDVVMVQENNPVFLVKCSIEKNYLSLKNGYKGYFKKGMTVTGHFIVTRRTLFDLLFDKMEDWLNPMNNSKE